MKFEKPLRESSNVAVGTDSEREHGVEEMGAPRMRFWPHYDK